MGSGRIARVPSSAVDSGGNCRAGITVLLHIVLISKFAGFGVWA
jgi:hypothetical protein